MTGTSSKKLKQTESNRLLRGACIAFYEYILELRTEPFISVGCDGAASVIRAWVSQVPDEADSVS